MPRALRVGWNLHLSALRGGLYPSKALIPVPSECGRDLTPIHRKHFF